MGIFEAKAGGGLLLALGSTIALPRQHPPATCPTWQDPTGCIGGTISQQALEAEPGIQPGSVLILEKVGPRRMLAGAQGDKLRVQVWHLHLPCWCYATGSGKPLAVHWVVIRPQPSGPRMRGKQPPYPRAHTLCPPAPRLQVTVLRLPSLRPLHHVCITLDNIAQVIPAAPAAASQPAVLAAPAARPLSVPLLPPPAAPSTAGGPAPSWLGPSPSPALTMSSAGSLVAGAPPGGRQGWAGAQGPRHAAGPGPSQMATPCSQPPQLAQPQCGQRHGQHMGVQLQAGSYGGPPPGQQQQGQQRGGFSGPLPPASQAHSEQGQHMEVQRLVFGGQPPPQQQQQQHQAGRAQFSGPQAQQPSAPPAFSQGLAGGRSQQAQPTSIMHPQHAQPTSSMQPPPPRLPLGNLSNSQQWTVSQGGPAGAQQQHVTSRGAAWLQGLLQVSRLLLLSCNVFQRGGLGMRG